MCLGAGALLAASRGRGRGEARGYRTGKVKAYLEAAAPQHTNVTVKVLGFKANPWVR